MKKLLIIIITLFITGCINYTELNELNIVNGLSIVKENNSYKIYFSILEPSKDDGLVEYSIKLLETSADSLDKAFMESQKRTTKKLIYSQIEIITIDNEIFNTSFNEVINYLFYLDGVRRDFPIVLVDTNDYKKIIEDDGLRTIKDLLEINKKKYKNINYSSLEKIYSNLNSKKPVLLPKVRYDEEVLLEDMIKFNNEVIK